MKIYHAFYSRKQEEIKASEKDSRTGRDKYAGTIPVYRFTDGKERVCTELKETKEGHNFPDSIYLGEVEVPGNFVRSIKATGKMK